MAGRLHPIVLDYRDAASDDLLRNLSAATTSGRFLWTASDEGRTIERLEPHGSHWRLHRQLVLDELFPGLPPGEADLEAIAIDDDRLYVCGSHSRARAKDANGKKTSKVEARPARALFGQVRLGPLSGNPDGPGKHAPLEGTGSLRHALAGTDLGPLMEKPTKEGGLDVEGLVVKERTAWFGLRGPIVEKRAAIAEIAVAHDGALVGKPKLHRIDLGGLGVRDLCRDGADLLVLAGPMDASPGPYRLFRWRAGGSPQSVHVFETAGEKPEGLCRLPRQGQSGLLIVYDEPNPRRIKGAAYEADWLELG